MEGTLLKGEGKVYQSLEILMINSQEIMNFFQSWKNINKIDVIWCTKLQHSSQSFLRIIKNALF